MEEKCFKCERNEEEVKLVDAVSDNEIVKICEDCNIGENLPMIRKPSTFQLKESEKPYTIKERLRSMAGLPEEKQEKEAFTLDSLRKDYRKILDEKFLKQEKKNVPISLIDNYNWHISMARKKKKLTRKQLADMIGESETAIKMIENKELVEDALILIKKLEQFFGIKLRKDIENEETRAEERAEKSIRERFGKIKEEKEEKMEKEEPSVVLKFDKKITDNLTIDELRKMKEAREREEKQKRAKEKEEEIEEDVSKLIWRVEREEQAREKKGSKKSEENLFSNEVDILDE